MKITKKTLINNGAGILLVSALITFIYNSVESHSADQRFRKIIQSQLELQNHKSDSLMGRQKLYEDAIDRLRYSINEKQMEVRVIERQREVIPSWVKDMPKIKPDPTVVPYYLESHRMFINAQDSFPGMLNPMIK